MLALTVRRATQQLKSSLFSGLPKGRSLVNKLENRPFAQLDPTRTVVTLAPEVCNRMGAFGSRVSQEKLDTIQDEVLARISDYARDVDKKPVSFKRVRTVVGSDENGPDVIHSIECHPLNSDASTVNSQKPIVMLHGYGAGSLLFANNMCDIAQSTGRSVIAVDWLGCGSSGRPKWIAKDELEAIDWFIEPLDKWRAHRGLEKFDIVAHSLGGYLATHYVLKMGSKYVDKLVLASPFGIPEIPDGFGKDAGWFLRSIFWLWDRGVNPNQLVRGVGPYGPKFVRKSFQARCGSLTLGFKGLNEEDESSNTLLADYMYQITAMPASGEHALSAIMVPGAFARRPLIRDLPELSGIELMIIYGNRDWLARDLGTTKAALEESNLPKAEMEILPGNHHIYLSPYFDNLVTDFFK